MSECRHNCGQGAHPVYAPHLKEGEVECRDCGHIEPAPPPLTFDDCIDGGEHKGDVKYRYALSGTGKSFPRCDKHWDERLDRQSGYDERYPDSPTPPPGFDPSYAGESWDGE
jgi:hypothetical protein